MSGMGTSLATVGAHVLAAEMKAADGDYPTAFAKYEAALRGFAAEAQKLAESVQLVHPANETQAVVEQTSVVVDATARAETPDDRGTLENRKSGEARGPTPLSVGRSAVAESP